MIDSAGRKRDALRLLLAAVVIAAAFVVGFMTGDGSQDAESHAAESHAAQLQAAAEVWTCSMHPNIRLPESGQCPICYMDLILQETDLDDDGPARALRISESAAALADITVAPVLRLHPRREVRLSGLVAADESSTRTLTAWFPGRIDTLFVSETGAVVAAGDPLASVYSPELYAAGIEYRSALAGAAAGGSDLMRRTALATVAASRERLRRWGLDDTRIEALATSSEVSDHIVVTAPRGGIVLRKMAVEGQYVAVGHELFVLADLGRVWIELDAYESDLQWLAVGQPAEFRTRALPGRSFSGEVVFIDPVMDPVRRVAAVRIEADNPDGDLRPGAFVGAVVTAELDAAGNPFSGPDSTALLVVPATAPLITGKRAVVYVRDPDSPTPSFQGREIELGPRAGDHYVVVSGLQEGEMVVVSGAFKIDSAMQISALPSMMSVSGTVAATDPAPMGESIVPPAFIAALGEVLDAYLVLHEALSADDDRAAAAAAKSLISAIAGVSGPASLLPDRQRESWQRAASHLDGAAAAIGNAGDIASRRAPLAALSAELWDVLDGSGYSRAVAVRRFHCPMAPGGGADWIQIEPGAANPYFGSAMYRCGSQADSIPATGGDES